MIIKVILLKTMNKHAKKIMSLNVRVIQNLYGVISGTDFLCNETLIFDKRRTYLLVLLHPLLLLLLSSGQRER